MRGSMRALASLGASVWVGVLVLIVASFRKGPV